MRCVSLLPSSLDPRVQIFREQYDPPATKIEPHITVVFPFDSSLDDGTLISHVRTVMARYKPFDAQLGEVKSVTGGWIYFLLAQGGVLVRRISKALHRGPLSGQMLRTNYEPHVTIAQVDEADQDRVLAVARTLSINQDFQLAEALVERIAEDDSSIELARVPLG